MTTPAPAPNRSPEDNDRRSIDIDTPEPGVMHAEPLGAFFAVRAAFIPVTMAVLMVRAIVPRVVRPVARTVSASARFVRWLVAPDAGRWA